MNLKEALFEFKCLKSLGGLGEWDPFRVFKITAIVLKKSKRKTDEIWNILESYIISGLRLGCFKEALNGMEKLQIRFPNSHRLGALMGMACEAKGDFEQANQIYNDHLQRSDAKLPFMKRKCALSMSQQNWKPCIQNLCSYVEYFPNDVEAWYTLGDLYIDLSMYHQALFCLEEALLWHPSPFTFMKLGEVYYTLHMYELALHYLSRSIEMQPQSLMGYLSVFQCLLQLQKHSPTLFKSEYLELHTLVSSRLRRFYQPDSSASPSLMSSRIALMYIDRQLKE